MGKYEQLIAKALSTDSADEAYSCLQMAKKYTPQTSDVDTQFEGHTAQEWALFAVKLEAERDAYERLYFKYREKSTGYKDAKDLYERKNGELSALSMALGVVCILLAVIMVI